MTEMNRKMLKQLSNLIKNGPKVRKKVFSDVISKMLQNIPELVNYISDSSDNKLTLEKLFFEISSNLLYKTYKKGDFIQRVYDTDKLFIISLEGTYAKIDIKYNRIYLTCKEYLSYLIKLRLLNEKYLYLNCLIKNKTSFPLNEKVDILNINNVTQYLNVTNYDDLLKSVKLKIDQSPWKLNSSKNIDDFLKLYNPELSNKINFLDSEPRYPTYLPYYIFDKNVNSPKLFGHLNKPKNIKNLSAYICLNDCQTFYIDKSIIPTDSKLFSYFNEKMSEIITKNLFDKHYIFKSTDRYFLINNYSKLFQKIKINKGDYIIHQDRPHEGVFFIINGILELESNRSFVELDNLNFALLHCLDNFPNVFTKMHGNIDKFMESLNQQKDDSIEQIVKSNIFSKRCNQKRKISFITYKYPDIIGLNEIYDYKSGINNYSVKCLSNEANIFFAPNEIMNSMLSEENLNRSIGELVSHNRKLVMNSVNKYKKDFIKSIRLEIENSNSLYLNNKYKTQNNLYSKNNIICRSNSSNKFNTINSSANNFIKNNKKNLRMIMYETPNDKIYKVTNNLTLSKNDNESNLVNNSSKNKNKQKNYKSINTTHNSDNLSFFKTAYNQKIYLNNNNSLERTNNISDLKRNSHGNIKKKLSKTYSRLFNESDKNSLINSHQVGNLSIPIIFNKNNKFDGSMNNSTNKNNINKNLYYLVRNKTRFKLRNMKKQNTQAKIYDMNKIKEENISLSSKEMCFGSRQRYKSCIRRNYHNII